MHKFLTALVTASLMVAAFVAAPVSVRAAVQTYYVGPGADTGGSCTTPDFTTDGVDDDEAIQAAVDAAEGNAGVDTIIICDGTYTMTASIEPVLTEGLIIEGETSAALSVIDGADTYQFIDTDNDLTIRNLTLQEFNAGIDDGGVIHNNDDDGDLLIVEDSIFVDNSADEGGAIYWIGGLAEVADSTFELNHASDGGAILAVTAEIDNSTFEDNSADDDGGAIHLISDATIGFSTFEGNFAEDWGGAINTEYVINITNSEFVSNASWGRGGAVSSDNSVYTLESTFTANGTTSDGGAIFANDDASTGYSVFTDNTAGFRGGAIYTDNSFNDSSVGYRENHIYHSTFSGNQVIAEDEAGPGSEDGRGGAVFAEDECVITNSSFTGNKVSVLDWAQGGAVYCDEDIDLLADNRFSGNSAISIEADGDGGAIFAGQDIGFDSDSSGVSGAFRNTFTSNTASDEGGALYVDSDILTQFTRNIFKRNVAGGAGGGIYLDDDLDSSASFTLNRFEANRATDGDGGGVYFEDSIEVGSEFEGNRFLRNRAGGLGGGIRVWAGQLADEPLNLSRNTFAGNRAAVGGAVGGGSAASRGDARVIQRALKGNRLTKNKATQQRRTFNVGVEVAEF